MATTLVDVSGIFITLDLSKQDNCIIQTDRSVHSGIYVKMVNIICLLQTDNKRKIYQSHAKTGPKMFDVIIPNNTNIHVHKQPGASQAFSWHGNGKDSEACFRVLLFT